MKAVDLFSGCGGLSLGLENAGFNIVAAFDNWEPAIDVYKLNFSHPVIQQDLADIDSTVRQIKKLGIKLVAGGPPCQDFSSAGLQNHSGERADLTYSFADIVTKVNPKYFVMENVDRITKSHVLVDVMQQFLDSGYGLTAVILDASYCGAPQARQRFFLIGASGKENNFLRTTLIDQLALEPMTMRQYFGNELGTEYYYRHPRNYSRRAVYTLDEPSATIRGVNRPIPAGYKLNPNDPQNITMAEVRPLTTEERARVQTFPHGFRFLGSKTKQEQMIGNAVPVALAEFVGKALLDFHLNGSKRPIGQAQLFSESVNDLIPIRALHKEVSRMSPRCTITLKLTP
jgi:DNA (cytosine-5)-methyltransferase 1